MPNYVVETEIKSTAPYAAPGYFYWVNDDPSDLDIEDGGKVYRGKTTVSSVGGEIFIEFSVPAAGGSTTTAKTTVTKVGDNDPTKIHKYRKRESPRSETVTREHTFKNL